METTLATIPEIKGIELAVAQPIIDAFLPHFTKAQELADFAKTINVTDPTDLDGIAAAREVRLGIRAERIAANKVRESKKEVYLRMGKAIQGIYNRIDAIATPEEERLQGMEDIAERIQRDRKEKAARERTEAIRPYANVMDYPDLGNMTPAGFDALLSGLKVADEKRKADVIKAENDRLAAEAERREREKAMAEENARLKAEAEEKAKAAEEERQRVQAERAAEKAKSDAAIAEQQRQIEAERKAAEAKRKAAEDAARKEREALEEKAKQERAAAEAIARKEREARAKAEAELAAKKAAEAAEAKRIAAEKAKAEAAPDIDKTKAYINALMNVATPTVSNIACQQFIKNVVDDLNHWMERAEKL